MLVHPLEKFLTLGGASAPSSGFVAVGIHPSSEVDLVDVNGQILGVGALVALNKSQTAALKAVRRAPGQLSSAGDDADVGQKLVLQYFEACDPLVAPGHRDPTSRAAVVKAADLGVVAGGANCAIRLPFQGRRMARISFKRIASSADVSLVVVGASYGDRRVDLYSPMYVEKTAETWWNGGGSAPVLATGPLAAVVEARQVYVGGFGDAAEHFDELQIYVYGAADAGNDVHVAATAYGEER